MTINEKAARENVLKNIRNASLIKVGNLYSDVNLEAKIYAESEEEDLLIRFAKELTQIGGSFVYCSNENEFFSEIGILINTRGLKSIFTLDTKIKELLERGGIKVDSSQENIGASPVIMTGCENIVARLGSVTISSKQMSGRLANFIPDVHIVVAYPNQVVSTVKDSIEFLKTKYNLLPSMISFITGPSRTADIEKTLVMGAHGPRELIVFILDKN